MAFTIFNHICNEAEGNWGGYLMAIVRRTAETKRRKRKGLEQAVSRQQFNRFHFLCMHCIAFCSSFAFVVGDALTLTLAWPALTL